MKRYVKAAIASASDYDYESQKALALDSATTSEILDQLADSSIDEIRKLVAKNQNTSVDTMLKLCDTSAADVVKEIAQHLSNRSKYLPVVLRLAQDSDSDIRLHLLYNFTLPDVYYEPMINDPEPEVRRILVGILSDPTMIDRLVEDDCDEVRLEVASNPETSPETLHKLINDKDRFIRSAVASNKHTAPEDLTYLANDDFYRVRLNVAKNWYTPIDAVRKLVHDSNEQVAEKAYDRVGGDA